MDCFLNCTTTLDSEGLSKILPLVTPVYCHPIILMLKKYCWDSCLTRVLNDPSSSDFLEIGAATEQEIEIDIRDCLDPGTGQAPPFEEMSLGKQTCVE